MTPDPRPDVVARGWATIELDRAAAELAPLLADDGSFVEAERSTLLGARARRGPARADDPAGVTLIVLLEPDTEGRIAAFLARHGEGWAVTWMPSDAAAARFERGSSGPLGAERLAEASPLAGPFPMVLATATIER